jgi:hypothetical protein
MCATKPRRLQLARSIGALLLLSSCAISNHRPFPGDWTPPVAAESELCPDIAGTYRNLEDAEKRPLTHRRLMHQWYVRFQDFPVKERWSDVDRIEIRRLDPDRLQVNGLAGTEVLFTRTLAQSAGEFGCAGGWLSVKGSSFHATSSAFMSEEETRSFQRTGDHLLERIEGRSFWLFLIAPVFGSGTDWARYRAD